MKQQMRQAFIRTSNLLQSINASHQERQSEVEGAAAEKKKERKPRTSNQRMKYSRRRGSK
jgi:hypothetical protein